MKVIIHCSDSKFGNAATIALWHGLPKPRGRGWRTIGYRLVILNGYLGNNIYHPLFDGYLETGRPFNDDDKLEAFEYGAHTRGLNSSSESICLIGKSGIFTEEQLLTVELIALPLLKHQYGKLEISQHSDHDSNKPYCAGLPQELINKWNNIFNNEG